MVSVSDLEHFFFAFPGALLALDASYLDVPSLIYEVLDI